MAEKRFTDTIEEKLALISPTVKAIEFGGDQPYLRELQTLLRQHLASLVVLFERDPGLDAATADLYAAAAAVVQDTTGPLSPSPENAVCSRRPKHASRSASRPHARTEEEPALLGDRTSSFLPPDPSPGSASATCVPEPNPLPFSPEELLSVLSWRAISHRLGTQGSSLIRSCRGKAESTATSSELWRGGRVAAMRSLRRDAERSTCSSRTC